MKRGTLINHRHKDVDLTDVWFLAAAYAVLKDYASNALILTRSITYGVEVVCQLATSKTVPDASREVTLAKYVLWATLFMNRLPAAFNRL